MAAAVVRSIRFDPTSAALGRSGHLIFILQINGISLPVVVPVLIEVDSIHSKKLNN